MTDTLPSSSLKKSFLYQIALFSVLFIGASFDNPNSPPCRPDDAEVMQLRQFVSGYAQNFTGVRYLYAGGSTRTGFDCSGFTSYIFKEFGLKASPSSNTQSSEGVAVPLEEALPGDLIFFGRGNHIQHVAMVVENTPDGIICVHCTSSRGVVVENVSTSKYWKSKILFARDVITGQAKF
jgi:cell wall-associated NlpC family hydrolase